MSKLEFVESLTKKELYTICNLSDTLDKIVEFKKGDGGKWKLVNYFSGEDIEDCYCLSQYSVRSTPVLKHQNKELCDRVEVGKPYYLSAFNCGGDGCSPGHPKEDCRRYQVSSWSYNDPGKCACWQPEELVSVKYEGIENDYYFSLLQPTIEQLTEKLIRTGIFEMEVD